MKTLTLELHGGIGNQLFQYYAGKYLALKKQQVLVADCSHLVSSWEQHVLDASSIDLSPLSQMNLPAEYIVQNKFRFNIEKLRRHRLSQIGRPVALALSPFRQSMYIGNDIGFDEQLEFVGQSRIAGYFQTYQYFEDVLKLNPYLVPRPKNSSEWFIDMSEKALADQPVMVHVRRHYEKLDSIFTTLKSDYYSRSFSALNLKPSNRPIWIFSQKGLELDKYVPINVLSRSKVIIPPDSSPDFESLILMSRGSALICANSTFSYWSGLLGSSKLQIVAPAKVYVDRENPLRYYPDSWTLV
jgi:hypothetical protein